MAEDKFKCSGNCLNCQPAQRAYCASQHAYSNMRVLDSLMEIVLGMQSDVKVLKEKIEAIQSNEALVFDPNKEEKSEIPNNPIAQEGDGENKIEPQNNKLLKN